MKTALKDKNYGLRIYTLQRLNTENDSVKTMFEPLLTDIAKNDSKTRVKAAAISTLGRYKKEIYKPLFLKSIADSSYAIAAASLNALGEIDSLSALDQARKISAQQPNGALAGAVDNVLFKYGNESDYDSLAYRFDKYPFGNNKFMVLQPFANYLKRVKNTDNFKKGIDLIVSFRDTIPEQYRDQVLPYLNGMILNSIAVSKQAEGLKEQADYVKSKLASSTSGQATIEVPDEILQKYVGEYDFNGGTMSVVLNDKSLSLVSTDGPAMELTAVSNSKFVIKYMDGLSVEFNQNEKGEITEMTIVSPNGPMKAPKKK